MKKITTFNLFLISSYVFSQISGSPVSGTLPINENLAVLFFSFVTIATSLYYINKKKTA